MQYHQTEEIIEGLLYLFSSAITFIIGLVFYIFTAISLYAISKKRGYDKPWLAFIPIANFYLMGAIADNINLVIKKKTIFRRLALILSGSFIFSLIMIFVFIFKGVENSEAINQNPSLSLGIIMGVGIFYILIIILRICYLILLGFILYRIYMDYTPNNAVAFLVLSLIFKIHPFFLFSIRNKPSISMYYVNQQPQQYYYQQS